MPFKVIEGGGRRKLSFSEADLRAVEARFHELIRERARFFDVSTPALPRITSDLVDKPYPDGQREWTEVGYGGFAWSLSMESGILTLDTEYWSKVDTRRRWEITPDETSLAEEGLF